MRPLGVELLNECVEAGLLLKGIQAWRAGGFLFPCRVHALMAAVLRGMTWLDALDADTQAQPPDGKLGKVEQGVGAGERDAIVGSDGCRQSALSEQVLEGGDRAILADGVAGLAGQQAARGMVGDGEGGSSVGRCRA